MVVFRSSMLYRVLCALISKRLSRLILIFSALLTGATITAAMTGIYFDINNKMNVELRSYGANFYLAAKDNQNFAQNLFTQAINLADKNLIVSSSAYFYTTVRAEQQDVAVVGLDFKNINKVEPFWQIIAGHLLLADFDDKNAVIGIELANKLQLKVGAKIGLILNSVDGKSQQKKIKIKGIVETGDSTDNMLIVNLFTAQAWANSQNQIHHGLFLLHGDNQQIENYAHKINASLPLQASPLRKISQAEGEILPKIKYLMGIITLVILVLSALCVNTTLISSITERAKEFALHKALGATKRNIITLVLLEVLCIALFASLFGIVVGFILAQILGVAVFDSTIDLRWQIVPSVFLITILTSLIAALIPLKRIFTISPATTLKGE